MTTLPQWTERYTSTGRPPSGGRRHLLLGGRDRLPEGRGRLLHRLLADRSRLRRQLLVAGVAAALAALSTAGFVARRRLVRLRVEGLSMVPVLAPGDHVLVWRTDRIAVGDIVAFSDLDEGDTILVKRVVGVDRSAVRVEGDNAGSSRDSRHFGPVPRALVIGRVVWNYWSPYRPARDVA